MRNLKEILTEVRNGEITINDAEKEIESLFEFKNSIGEDNPYFKKEIDKDSKFRRFFKNNTFPG